ncbi:hypothetical protein EMCRGX_G031419 [Ephydatia muelleri]
MPPETFAHTRPADILIAGWDRGKPVALDLTITSLCSAILSESCHQAGAAALAAEARKLHSNDLKCQELGWSCIPLAVETYGNWGKEAHDTFSMLASYLAIHQSSPKSAVVAEIYCRLNIALVRSIASHPGQGAPALLTAISGDVIHPLLCMRVWERDYLMEATLTQFLSQYHWLTDSYVIEFFVENHWNKLPSKWREVLDKTSLAEIYKIFLNLQGQPTTMVYPLSLLAFLACTRNLMYQRHPQATKDIFVGISSDHATRERKDDGEVTMGSQVKGMDHAFRHCIKPKKQYEIKVLGEAVFRLSEVTRCKNVIDIGSGQGHLARYLAFEYGLNVVTMEAVGCHITTATKLDSFAENALKRKKRQQAMCPHEIKGSLRHIVAMIDPNISPEELLGHVTSDQPEPTRKYLLVGLHTCGDLAPTILRLFAKSDSVVGVVSVGCCYMKVTCLSCDQPPAPNIPTCECDMAATCVHTCATKDPRVPLGYPMSGRIMSLPSHSLSYEAREMACHALEAYAERLEDTSEDLRVHCHRALVERGLKRGQLKMPRSVSKLPFVDYAKAVLQSAGVSFTFEEIEALVPMAVKWWERVAVFFLLRLLLAPCVETLVLLDRVLYLQEQAYPASITPLFEPRMSPRNLVIVAHKHCVK